jgi:hypothetical protein
MRVVYHATLSPIASLHLLGSLPSPHSNRNRGQALVKRHALSTSEPVDIELGRK